MSKEKAFTESEIRDRLSKLAGWIYEDGAIRRTYKTDGWRGSMLVTNAIAFLCETADHHADITVTWPAVKVALSTHSAGGITEKDFEVARMIEELILRKLPKGSSLSGPSKPFATG